MKSLLRDKSLLFNTGRKTELVRLKNTVEAAVPGPIEPLEKAEPRWGVTDSWVPFALT